jgi:hypothetical protein
MDKNLESKILSIIDKKKKILNTFYLSDDFFIMEGKIKDIIKEQDIIFENYTVFNDVELKDFQYYIDSFMYHNKNNIFYQSYGNKTYYLFVDNLVLSKTYGKDVSYSVYNKNYFLNKYYNEQKH